MKFKPGEYDFSGSEQGITIKGDNITVDGIGVRIYNAKDADILADVNTGAYAYQLNPVDGETSYCLTRNLISAARRRSSSALTPKWMELS